MTILFSESLSSIRTCLSRYNFRARRGQVPAVLVLSLNLGQLPLSKKKAVVQSVKLYRNTLWSNEAAMTGRFRRLSVFGWLIVTLVAASVETHAQDLEPRAFANAPVGLNFLIGGYAYAKGTVGTDASVPLEDTEVTLNSAVLA